MTASFALGVALVAVSAVASYLVVAAIRGATLRAGILDIPNDRSSHVLPIPRGGGLAIVIVALISWIIFTSIVGGVAIGAIYSYVLAGLLIVFVGGIDDLRTLPNRVRLETHLLAALIVIIGIGAWGTATVPLFGQVNLGWLGVPVTLLWIVGLTNAYNFMDGIDGIAGGQAVVAGLGWTALGMLTDQPAVAALGAFLAAGSLGFLFHNWHPARIFMGDVSSGFLGFSFATLAVLAARSDPRLAIAGILLVWPFVYDTAFTMIRRARKRENIFLAHRSHLFQRLVIAGASHTTVTTIFMILAAVGVVCAVIVRTNQGVAADLALVLPVLLAQILWFLTVGTERSRRRSRQAEHSIVNRQDKVMSPVNSDRPS